MEKTYSTQQLEELAGKIAQKLKPNDVLALYGELGSGKTTFTRFLVKALGFDTRVQSPTFILVRNYTKSEGSIKKIFHIDLYRLKSVNEVLEIGINEMIDEDKSVTVIEWPEIYEQMLPEKTIRMYFEYADKDTRKVTSEHIDGGKTGLQTGELHLR